MAHHRVQQWSTFARTWWLFDAKWQCPWKSAKAIIPYLQGTNKPIYHPLSDTGDHVVVINTRLIAMKNERWIDFKHIHDSRYRPKGIVQKRAWQLHDENPTKIFEKAVYSSIDKNLLRRGLMARLHLFSDEDLPEDLLKNISNCIRQPMLAPKRLDEYTEEERKNFPKLFDWPKDYVLDDGFRTKKQIEFKEK